MARDDVDEEAAFALLAAAARRDRLRVREIAQRVLDSFAGRES